MCTCESVETQIMDVFEAIESRQPQPDGMMAVFAESDGCDNCGNSGARILAYELGHYQSIAR